MTTLVEATIPATKTKTRKKPVRRGFNELGKFFAKVRIDLDLTSSEWAKKLGASDVSISNLERADGKLTLDLAVKINAVLVKEVPQYVGEFAGIVAEELNVLLIPAGASHDAVEEAFMTLRQFDFQAKQASQSATAE